MVEGKSFGESSVPRSFQRPAACHARFRAHAIHLAQPYIPTPPLRNIPGDQTWSSTSPSTPSPQHGACPKPSRSDRRSVLICALQQSSESRLYTFADETKQKLRKFRLGTSRAKDPQAVICMH
jgi:hypothetical protein